MQARGFLPKPRPNPMNTHRKGIVKIHESSTSVMNRIMVTVMAFVMMIM